MKKLFVLFILVSLFAIGFSTTLAQGKNTSKGSGITVTCDNGASFNNGVKVIVVQMRSGFNYTATAIGINGFDPVLAVFDERTGNGLCSDDHRTASYYEADLPTSGYVEPNRTTAQVTFSQNSRSAFADVSLVVGGLDDQEGEVVVILEGMAATSADGTGDIFAVQLTPSIVNAEIPLTAYMIAITDALDPLLYLAAGEYDEVMEDTDGNFVYCDDAGSRNDCWGTSDNLRGAGVSRTSNRAVPGGTKDAMLSIPLTNVDLEAGEQYYTFISTSYRRQTFGDYVMAFHFGISNDDSTDNTTRTTSTRSAGSK
jgi:hypothetical protein